MAAPNLPCCTRLPLAGASGGCSLVAMCRLLIVPASLAVKRGLQGEQASVVQPHGLSCPTASEIFLDRGLNLCPLHRQGDSEPLGHPESLPTVLETSAYSSFLSSLD